MTTDEMYQYAYNKEPQLLYVSGKTCTGKTNFSKRLSASSGYRVIELDKVVLEAIVNPFDLQGSQGDVFLSVYKTADNAGWIDIFVTEAQKRIKDLLMRSKKVIIDGAVANPTIMQKIFDGLPEVLCIYFHPLEASPNYQRNLTNRFKDTTAQNENGLPKAFWECINKESFARFCSDRSITPELEQGIRLYAQRSSQESVVRLGTLQKSFPHIMVVEV